MSVDVARYLEMERRFTRKWLVFWRRPVAGLRIVRCYP
jgi:hypothetical protein